MTMKREVFCAVTAVFFISGCATSTVRLESNTPGAAIYKAKTLHGPWQRVPDQYSITPLTLRLAERDRDGFLKAKKYGFSDSEAVPVSKVINLEKYSFSISALMRGTVYDQFYDKSIVQANIPETERKNVAVLDFSISPASIGDDSAVILTELFQDVLVKAKAFNVIDRRRMESVLKELKLQQSGVTNADAAASLGKLLNAQEILMGTVRGLGSKRIVSVSMVDVETSKIIYSDTGQYQSEEDLKALALVLANKLTATRFR